MALSSTRNSDAADDYTEEVLRYRAALIDHVSDALIATTVDGIVTSWNPAAEAIYGRTAAQALALPVSEAVGASLDLPAVVNDGGVVHATHYTSDGGALAVRVSVAAMDNGFVLLCSDHTALRRAEQHFQTIVNSLEEGIVEMASDGRIDLVNPAALRILGIDHPDGLYDYLTCTETSPRCRSHGQAIDCGQRSLCALFQIRESRTGHIVCFDRPADGQRRWLSANCRLLNPEYPHDSAVLFSIVDVTTQHNAREELAYVAAHDALTGLPNHAQLTARIDNYLHSIDENTLGAVLFIDLDNFKAINDTHGHSAGNQVLQAVAQQLRTVLRSSDIVARFGGDEFVALILGKITRAELDKLAKRIHTALAEPICRADAMLSLRASIGIVAIEGDDPRDGDQILRDADTAMYQAKLSGGGTSCYDTEAPHQRTG
ncbi:sensor domain-containing diguanylate cyclase [Mycobacterium haemophilum]|uniref:sensor domain-containing diguanylate cyclase n=1 Tax=Mycobacterium haemophilum TaxID=29311 RepID=UPI0018CEE8D9|nr:sensor domain-containing diguanylate cyclase [Mycobacterium haemophilum]